MDSILHLIQMSCCFRLYATNDATCPFLQNV